jgi:hypothetical protein
MDSIFFVAATSVSQMYGNVINAVQMYLENNMPKDFLADRSVSTRSSFRYFRRYLHTHKEFEAKQKPFMIIRPSVEMYDNVASNDFLSGTQIIWHQGVAGGSKLAKQTFLTDSINGIGLGFKINRYKMNFEIMVQCNTYYSALDLYNYLNNTFVFNRAMYIPTSLESLIPKDLLYHVCEIVGINIDDRNNIPVLTQYLRQHASYPISYKMRNSTSNDEYFLFYPQNLVSVFSDLQCEEMNRKNMVEDPTNVTFKIECEFNAIASYYAWNRKNTHKKFKLCIHESDHSAYIPIYTFERTFSDKPYIEKGYTLYSSNIIKTEKQNEGKDDTFSILECIQPDLKRVMDTIISNGNDMQLLLIPRVIMNDKDVEYESDFVVNWSKYEVTIKNSDPYKTYRLIFYINLAYYNSFMVENITITDQQNLDGKSYTGYPMKP